MPIHSRIYKRVEPAAEMDPQNALAWKIKVRPPPLRSLDMRASIALQVSSKRLAEEETGELAGVSWACKSQLCAAQKKRHRRKSPKVSSSALGLELFMRSAKDKCDFSM